MCSEARASRSAGRGFCGERETEAVATWAARPDEQCRGGRNKGKGKRRATWVDGGRALFKYCGQGERIHKGRRAKRRTSPDTSHR